MCSPSAPKTQRDALTSKLKELHGNIGKSLRDKYRFEGIYRALKGGDGLSLSLSTEEKHRCLMFITKKKLFNNENSGLMNALQQSVSQSLSMSFKTFISLLHLEIMVTKPDSISDEDVLEAFLNAAYESCRGYNLNDKGVDTDLTAPSKPLCLSGSFNKFCEILSPFSPKILHFFVSDSTIMARVKCLFLERLSKHVDDSGQYGRLYDSGKTPERH